MDSEWLFRNGLVAFTVVLVVDLVIGWRYASSSTLVHAEAPTRRAAQRAAAEAMWISTVLLPRFEVDWEAADKTHISARYQIDDIPVHVHYQLTPSRHIEPVVSDRWGDPDNTGAFNLHPFGGEFTSHQTSGGMTIPDVGRLGWYCGTHRWAEGEFFRYQITDLHLITLRST
jgi:hypothetical protein